jgi:hypothetical protein
VVADVPERRRSSRFTPDHIDRPIMMTDASKAIVGRATYLPNSEVYAITGSA